MENNIGVILTYGIRRVDGYWSVTIEATNFDANGKPTSWAIRNGRDCLNKHTGWYDYEPLPSERDDEFLESHRFSSPEEAKECYSKLNNI